MLSYFRKMIGKLTKNQYAEPALELMTEYAQNYLLTHVDFYKKLGIDDRLLFEKRVLLFLQTTEVLGYEVDVDKEDKLLVAAGAIIPVWSFPEWHYINLDSVILLPSSFNERSEFKKPDSVILGMVGTGRMSGKMFLSKPALHYGFSNSRDKKNVAIHEFSHLIDMADGSCDGFPERLSQYAFCVPWFDMVHYKMNEIDNRKSNIGDYAATNKVEFFAVATEYFFERPGMLQKKHPNVYAALKDFYQQGIAAIGLDVQSRRKKLCSCGSGEYFQNCCMPAA